MNQYHEKIIAIMAIFGMNGVKAAEIMNLSSSTYRNKRTMQTVHSFNEKNYMDLVKFIKAKANELP